MVLNKETPLYLSANFEFFEGHLAGRKLVWVKVHRDTDSPPDRLQNQKFQLERILTIPVVFIFEQLDSWQRKRLIERQVGFIQTGKQIYMPEWLLQLSDIRSVYRYPVHRPERLSVPAQVAALYHLQRESLNGLPAQQVAFKLGYSAMTISRIGRELEQFELATLQSGKERAFIFNRKGEELWYQALPLLRDPIKEEWFAYNLVGIVQVLEAGETALATYSFLAEGQVKYFAIGKEQYKSLQTLKRLPELNKHQGNYGLQVWQYDPAIIAGPGKNAVDKLSLYLTLMSRQDERIQASLAEMINQMLW